MFVAYNIGKRPNVIGTAETLEQARALEGWNCIKTPEGNWLYA